MRVGCNQQLGLPTNVLQFPLDLTRLSAGVLPLTVYNATQHPTGSDGDSEGSHSVLVLPRVEVRASPGRGFGLFAVDSIPRYTQILEDDALLSLARGEDLPQLWEKYCLLPPAYRQVFDDLSFPPQLATKESTMILKLEQRGYETFEAQNMARVNSRWQANAFKTALPSTGSAEPHTWSFALFSTVARINHSCTPNAHAHNRPSATNVVYALREISAGEEIEMSYFDLTMASADRKSRAAAWGFQCSCPACSKTGDFAFAEYEQCLSNVHRHLSVDYAVYDSETLKDSVQTAISWAHSSRYPWLVATLPKLYLSLFNVEKRLKRRSTEAREALVKVLEWEEKITGPGSPWSQEKRRALLDFDAAD